MSGVLDTIAASSPSRRSVTLCMDAALQAEWDACSERLLDAADDDTKRSLSDIPKTTAVVEEMEDLRERMKASMVRFDFERMPWTERVNLQAKHPPREDHLIDLMRGYNIETFIPALVRGSCISLTGAAGDVVTKIPEGTWTTLLGIPATEDEPAVAGTLNYKAVERLNAAANAVNDGDTAVPRSARSLLENRTSGASSTPSAPGPDRPRSAPAAGNRRTARKSSTTKKAPSKGKSART